MSEPKWYDLTLSKQFWTREQFISIAEEHCERFCVGDEIGANGYEHLQARVVFKIGKEMGAVINLFAGAHVSQSHERNFNYVMKEGNYYCSWEKAINKFANLELRRWQKGIVQDLEVQSEREITCIVDLCGGKGKTYLAKYLTATHQAVYCPPLPEALDYMAFALAHTMAKGFVFDLPRSDDPKKNRAMWSAIEQIKNGYLYDKRNQWREAWIDPPKVLVFTNQYPDTDSLSADRWRIYTLEEFAGVEDAVMLLPHTVERDESGGWRE